jgi:hypothetical protein
MIKAREPALFLSIYLHRQRREGEDPRAAILRQVDSFVQSYKLQVPEESPDRRESEAARYKRISDIDLKEVDSLHTLYVLLFEAQAGFPPSAAGYDATVYSYHDSIIIQLQITRFENWQGSLEAGWRELASELRQGFGERIAVGAESSVFGVSAVYWVVTDHKIRPESYKPDLGLEGNFAGCTQTDLGPLWNGDFAFFPETAIHQDLWVLVTPRESSGQADQQNNEVNGRYYRLASGPPPFGEIALARHKIFFELAQHRFMRKILEDRGRVLETKTFAFLAEQRRLGPKLDELASETAIQFEEKLTQATNRLAAYRNRLGRLRELRRTLDVNHRNYIRHCFRLISARKFKEVERSQDRTLAAIRALDSLDNDEIFSTDLGTIAQRCQQVDTDIGYSESVADRHTLALRSATDQLRIAGEREIAEMARHLAIDSAAVVASVAALVVIELAEKRHFDTTKAVLGNTVPKDDRFLLSLHSLEGWFLVAAVILLVYGMTQAFGARFRGSKPGMKSIVAGIALASAWIGMVYIYHPAGFSGLTKYQELEPHLMEHWKLIALPAVSGAVFAWLAYLAMWRFAKGTRKRNLALRRLRL